MSVKVLFLCLLAGAAIGAAEGGTHPLRKRPGLGFTVISDVCFAFISVFTYAVISYTYCDGQIFAYAAIAQIAAFAAARTAAAKIADKIKIKKRKSKARKQDANKAFK